MHAHSEHTGHNGALTLVANPGSASRKYALYDGTHELAHVHFEWLYGRVVCTIEQYGEQHQTPVELLDLTEAGGQVVGILQSHGLLTEGQTIGRVGLRIVAPSSYFLEDHVVDDHFIAQLEAIRKRAPIHIDTTLEELAMLRRQFPKATLVGVSDSAFHITKPDYAWNYGISLEDADRYEIKRFGYHGLSVASVVQALHKDHKLPPKVAVVHLGSGGSVTAVHGGHSIDNTMGYSPLEGIVMSTRSGSIDPTAVSALNDVFHWSGKQAEQYLNNHSGLLGLGGSSDIRELLRREADGDHRSGLALKTYVYSVQKAVGQMASALGGLDALVFTGTVSERSAPIRDRIIDRLHYLDFILDRHANESVEPGEPLALISRLARSKPIYVVPTRESAEIARHVYRMHT
jgi:acetate kinase